MSTGPSRSVAALLADPCFPVLKSLIVERTGHHYYSDKDEQFGERLAQRMAANGIGAGVDYLQRLNDPVRGAGEWRQLESELTIKETFFFRFAEQFTALRTVILPQLIEARGRQKRLRIWSAGCSTGAEPYSIAVVLSDLLGSALDDWQVSILGTDIDEQALANARMATYGGWSLRTMETDERRRLFVNQNGRWRLRLAYSAMVRFERLNILDLDGSAVPLQLSDYDLILCRNMLIYFHPERATRLVEAVGERLAPDGWLLLGHAEAGLAMGTGLVGVERGGIVAYRRPDAALEDALPPAVHPVPTANAPPEDYVPPPQKSTSARQAESRAARCLNESASQPVAPPAHPTGEADEQDLAEVRRLLDTGDTAAASVIIAHLRHCGRVSSRLFFFDAIRAFADNDRSVAERSLRSALYLDGGFVMAHYLLAQSLMECGRITGARRALLNASRALAAVAPDDPVAESDGRTADDLRGAIRARMMVIDGA